MAVKITVKKSAAEDVIPSIGQARPALSRFRLQVDRQTKSTFDNAEDAEIAGQAIKKAWPIVQVAIYDAEKSTQKILE